MNKLNQILNKKYVWALLVFVLSWFLYFLTTGRSIYLEDSAEFVTVADGLGVPHPSGYPLYVLFGKIFSLLLKSNVALAVNLMSAFWGALTVTGLFLITAKLFEIFFKREDVVYGQRCLNRLVPAVASLIFAASQIFWSQAVVAEVYTLNSFLLIVILLLLINWYEKIEWSKKTNDLKTKLTARKILLAAIFVFGLSLTNHQQMLLLAPVFFVFVLLVKRDVLKDYRLLFLGTGLLVVGLSVYLYLPIRASQNPDFNWGNPQSMSAFSDHLLRKQYNDLKFEFDEIFNQEKLLLINSFYQDLSLQFGDWLLLLVVSGLVVSWFKNKKILALLLGVFLFNGMLIVFLRAGRFTFMNEFIYRVYYIPAFMIAAIWLACGLRWLLDLFFNFLPKVTSVFLKRFLLGVMLVIILCLPIIFIISNYQTNDRSDFYLAADWARHVLESMDEGSYLMIYNDQPALDSMMFALYYMQAVERVRTDVKMVGITGVRGMFYQIAMTHAEDFLDLRDADKKDELTKMVWQWVKEKEPGRSVYVTYPPGEIKNSDLAYRSNGYVYKIYENLASAQADISLAVPDMNLRNLDYEALKYNLFYSDFVSDIYLAWAGYFLENNSPDLAQKFLIKAIETDASAYSFNYQAYVEHRAEWHGGLMD